MNTFGNSKNNRNSSYVLGGRMGWLDETGFETVARPVSRAAQTFKGVIKDILDLGQDIRVEAKKETNGAGKLPSNGSIEFNKLKAQNEQLINLQKQREETDRKKAFYQRLKEEQERVQRAKDRIFEEEINDIISNLPTDQKNKLLHYQASYRDRSIYQKAELRKKMIEEKNKAEAQKKATTIPSPAKQANAMDTAFEGGTGKSGTGSANFSATGGGAG